MKQTKSLLAGLGLAASLAFAPAVPAVGGGGHAADAGKQKSAEETITAAIEGNTDFKSQHDEKHFDPFQTGQVPNLTIITCADSRVHTQLFGIQPDNNIFAIRNVGNQIC